MNGAAILECIRSEGLDGRDGARCRVRIRWFYSV